MAFEISADGLPAVPTFSAQVRVYYYDTDAGGVVHNVAYLRMIEEARTRFAEYLGWPLKEMAAGPVVPVVARTEVDYIRPARLGDTLVIACRLAAVSAARFEIAFEVSRLGDAVRIAACRQWLVSVRLPEGRPVRTPAAWRERWPELAV